LRRDGDLDLEVAVGTGVFYRLEMDLDLDPGEGGVEGLFDVFDQIVAASDRPGARYQDVDDGETLAAGQAGTQAVEANLIIGEAGQNCGDGCVLLIGKGDVHEPLGGVLDQFDPGDDDVDPDEHGHNGVEKHPAGEPHKDDGHNHSGAGDDICPQMLAIRDEGGGSVLPARPDEDHPHDAVDHGGQAGDDDTDRDGFQGTRIEQAFDSGDDDEHRSDEDQHPFDGSGEVFCLVMAEMVVIVRRTCRDGQHA